MLHQQFCVCTAIYLHAMIVPLLHKNLHNKRFTDFQKAQGGSSVVLPVLATVKSTALIACQNCVCSSLLS